MDITSIKLSALEKISQADTLSAIEELRIEYLGKKGALTEVLKELGKLDPALRPKFGQEVNIAKEEIKNSLNSKKELLETESLNKKLASEKIDVTLPGRNINKGSIHPITLTTNKLCELFMSLGFDLAYGPEIETEFYNFESLNTPDHHPSRDMHDTFYFENKKLLRSHTSSVQIHAMQNGKPPFRLIAPGKVYRSDSDITHTPMFHQLEGLVVDDKTTFADLKGLLEHFLKSFFGEKLSVRFRASHFPFTEPSAEVDVECIHCNKKGCRVCSNTGWLEVLGCGMVHPNVLRAVNIDPEKYSGFAFGMGIDRFAMLDYKIPDIRLNFENNLDFLRQFK